MTSIDTFFELLRAGTWGGDAVLSSVPVNWTDVIELAKKQSVAGVIFDGLQTLPKELLPGKTYILDLIAVTYSIEKKE